MYFDIDGEGPLHRQLDRALRGRILGGHWGPGHKLPSTRALAREFGLARNTVLHAYEQLVGEGYAVVRRGAGTYVAAELPESLAVPHPNPQPPTRKGRATPPPALSAYGDRLMQAAGPRGVRWNSNRPRLPYDFRYGEPAYSDLPYASWCRVLARRARAASRRALDYGPPGGSPALQSALAQYLRQSRGVRCEPEQVIVVNGSQQAIDLTARLLVGVGDAVAIEDPHYPGHRLALEAAGGAVEAIPVDEHGIDVSRIPAGPFRLACITPSHQFPSGAVMPLPRRLELLDWARDADAWILEDDYDGEFRYDGRPVESLQGLDPDGRVIYTGTVSKVLFPSLRIGYLVAPEKLVDPFLAAKAFADTGGAGLEQEALAEFITSGAFERHLRRMRVRHATRRAALVEAVDQHLADVAHLVGANAGVHVVLWLREGSARRAEEWRKRAASLGVGVYSVHPFYQRAPRRGGLLLGYAALGEAQIREGIERLASAL